MFSKTNSYSDSVNSLGDYFSDSSSQEEYSSELNVQQIAEELIYYEKSKDLSRIELALLKSIFL